MKKSAPGATGRASSAAYEPVPDGQAARLPVQTRTLAARVPGRLRLTTRPPLVFEVLLIGISYWLYSLVRNAAPTHEATALTNADWILDVERMLFLDFERSVNQWFAGVEWLIVGANYYYATAHFIVTISVLVWLYIKHADRYRAARTALYLTNTMALVGYYLYPLAPPRLLPGYIDTVREFNTWGSLASGDLASQSNQFAAMPSMHVGWALWSGMALMYLARARWLRVAGMIYPMMTILVIIATANHYILDAVGGVLVLAAGFSVQYRLTGRRAFTSPPRTTPRETAEETGASPRETTAEHPPGTPRQRSHA